MRKNLEGFWRAEKNNVLVKEEIKNGKTTDEILDKILKELLKNFTNN